MGLGKRKTTFRSKQDRVQRQRLVYRIVVYGTAVVVVVVLGLVIYGIVFESLIAPDQPVATVNGEEITTQRFQLRVRYERAQLLNRYNTAQQNLQFFGDNPEIQAQINAQLDQIAQQLDPIPFGELVLDRMIEEALYRQEAERRGITVTDKEVDRAIQALFNFYPEGTPTPIQRETLDPTSTLSATQLALVTLTPTPTNTPTATASPLPEGTSAVPRTPSGEGEGEELTATPTSGIPTLTPTVYTTEVFAENFEQFVQVQEESFGIDASVIRRVVYNQLLVRKLFEEITAEVPTEEEQVWARHIQVEDERTANQVLQQLEEGADWAELAQEFSQDEATKENGGDLGWFNDTTRAVMFTREFVDTAFALDIGEISEPVKTPAGWHVIQALGHEVRQLTLQEREQRRRDVFNQWLEGAREEADIVIFEYWRGRVPSDPPVPVRPQQQVPQPFVVTESP